MSSIDEQILRAAKEIVVKFIETGRISPTTFPETFKSVYAAVNGTVKGLVEPPAADEPQPPAKG
jgi:predicted transcriptional regulator